MGYPAQLDALVGHHAEKDGESKAISAWKKRQMRVCLFFVWEKPLSLLRRQLPCRGEPLAGRAALSWTLEAQYGAKGRALLQRAAASGQRILSSCRCPGQRSTTAHETNKLCSFSGNLTDMPKPPLDRGGGCARGADGEVSSTAASKPDRRIINTKNYQMTSRNIF